MRLGHLLRAVGRVLVTAGTLILLFVAYQLWGTGLHTSAAQDDLEDEFEAKADEWAAAHPDPRPPRPGRPQPVPHAPARGELVGRIQIPTIGVDWMFLEGVGEDVLVDGPGHVSGTPLPGQEGNAGIAGHRTTYGAPFNRIDELREGDEILVSYFNGSQFTYGYHNTVHVTEDQVDVLEYKFDNRLTLTACHPKYSAAERIVVSALLVEPAAPAPPRPAGVGVDEEVPPIDSLDRIAGEAPATTPAVVWGVAAAMVWLTAWVTGRAWQPWPAYLVGLPVFLVMLYGFFENFSHTLPSSY